MVDDFCRTFINCIYFNNPQELIFLLQQLGDALCFRHLINQAVEHSFRLFIDAGKMVVQCTGQQELRIQSRTVLFQVILPPYAPDIDGTVACRVNECGIEIVSLADVSDLVFHDHASLFLRYSSKISRLILTILPIL